MSTMTKCFSAALALSCVIIFSGCATKHRLVMSAERDPLDKSVFSPKLKEKRFTKVMIIPPSGTVRGTFEPKLVLFEREFLRKGMTVISSAITGKVALDFKDNVAEKKNEGTLDLSDMERALIMAKNTGAEAILQLGEYKWDMSENFRRCFIADPTDGSQFRENEYSEWKEWMGPRWSFPSPELIFVGRVVDVNNGEVLATIDAKLPANFNLPRDYTAMYSFTPSNSKDPNINFTQQIEEYSYRYLDSYDVFENGYLQKKYYKSWLQEAMTKSEERLISYVASRLTPVEQEKK